MIIDSLTDKSSINIDKLTIPELAKKPETLFDPEKDLLPSDWEGIKNHLSELRQRVADESGFGILAWARFARYLVLLAPEHKNELGIDWEMGNKLIDLAKISSKDTSLDWERFLDVSYAVRILFPDRVDDLHLDDHKFGRVLKRLRLRHFEAAASEIAWDMVSAVEVFPDKVNEILAVDGQLAEVLGLIVASEIASKTWYGVIVDAAVLKILFPQQEFRLNSSSQAELREFFKSRKGEIGNISMAVLAFCMYVLAAEEVRIGKDGLVINLRKKDSLETVEKIPDMPIKRAF